MTKITCSVARMGGRAESDHQLELLGIAAVRIDACIRAEADTDAFGDGAAKGLIDGGDGRARLVRDARVHVRRAGELLLDGVRREQRRDEYDAFGLIMSSASLSRNDPCSIESMPARIARLAASAPCAWAAVLRFIVCVWSTSAFSSSSVSCGESTSSASESTPPLAHTLMTSAPYLTSARPAARIASKPLPGAKSRSVLGGARSGRIPRYEHARPRRLAVRDCVTQSDVDKNHAAHIAHGGKPCHQRHFRVLASPAPSRRNAAC